MTRAYDLGRARGYITGRAEATDADLDWFAERCPDGADEFDDFETGMLDGRDKADAQRNGTLAPSAKLPTAEDLAAARK